MHKYIILSLLFILMGCSGKNSSDTSSETKSIDETVNSIYEAIERDRNPGVTLTMNHSEFSLSQKDTIEYTISNSEHFKVMFGYRYTIDLWENNAWKNIPLKYAGFVDLGLIIHKGDERTLQIDLFKDQDYTMKLGKYRMMKDVTIYSDNKGKGDDVFIFAEFSVVE